MLLLLLCLPDFTEYRKARDAGLETREISCEFMEDTLDTAFEWLACMASDVLGTFTLLARDPVLDLMLRVGRW